MKKLYLLILLCNILTIWESAGQCVAPYTQSQLNWDFLDFLPSNIANYTTFYTAATRPYNQDFTIGTRRVNFAMAPTANITLNGENAINTAHAGSFATAGQDVQFTTINAANTTITITFDTDVANVKFSLFDLDANQRATFAATNSLAVGQPVVLTKANVLSGIVILGQQATGPVANYLDTDNNGSLNVNVVGPVNSITITLNNAVGTIWLGDIDACVTGSFPSGYRAISRPFTGMPAYILTVVNNEFKLLDPATGRIKHLFKDTSHTNMNGMAYDPYKRILYYTYSLMPTTALTLAEKRIFKYSVDNNTISSFIANVNAAPLNIPTYDPGVTSGSASFYNGALYFGVESANSARTSGRENTVWKIEFAADSITPVRASQVYATRSDSTVAGPSNRLIHDWSDIGVTNNGILYDFDGAGAGTATRDSMFYHFDMMSGNRLQFTPSGAGSIGPKQTAIDWQENIYNMGGLPTSSGTAQNIGGFIVPYNLNGTVNNALNRLVYTDGPVYPTGSWGDCSEAFRPLCDFGDAPASYDPDPLSPAVNEQDTLLRMGPSFDREWLKTSSVLADGDGADENGVGTVPIFSNLYSTYTVQDSVFNNTGANATVIGWLDYNGNGLFDVSEASSPVTVASGASLQTINLNWTGISSPLVSGSYTYLRIRVASTAYGMTSANATGWFDNGETEDYRVIVDNIVLPITVFSFDARAVNNSTIKLNWTASEEINFSGYEVQRSHNGSDWIKISYVAGSQSAGKQQYELIDNNPVKGTLRYRLKYDELNGQKKYSAIRTVKISDAPPFIALSPNPASNKAIVIISNTVPGEIAHIRITDLYGKQLSYQKIALTRGNNPVELPIQSWHSGTYIVLVSTSESVISKKLLIKK